MYGWQGKVLRVDLGKGLIKRGNMPEAYQSYLGGRGLATKIFSEEVDPSINPLSEENKIILATGPLTGTGASSGCICSIVTKSPLTNTITCGQAKMYFGAEIKAAGYDLIIIEGKSDSPVMLSIQDENIELLPADYLWGETTLNTENAIRLAISDPWKARETRILSIGPAGERAEPISTIITDGLPVRNGVGIGAIFGIKGLKAIAIRGTRDIDLAYGKGFIEAVSSSIDTLKESELSKEFSDFGTYLLLEPLVKIGALGYENFSKATPETVFSLSAKVFKKEIWKRNRGCFSCPIACLKQTKLGFFPEIDEFISLGPLCDIINPQVTLDAYRICIEYGLDAVEVGATMACAMQLQEYLTFGKTQAFLETIKASGRGEEIAGILNKGALYLARHFKSEDIFLGVKGRSIPPFDPRIIQGIGLQYATSNFGATHLTGFTLIEELKDPSSIKGKAKLVKDYQDKTAILESMGICPYAQFFLPLTIFIEMLNQATGLDFKEEKVLKMGEDIYHIERLFNTNAGIKNEDWLPPKMLRQPVNGMISKLDKMLKEYYELRGLGGEE